MDKTIIIQNPPVYMNNSYLENNALKGDYEGGTAMVIEKFGCPYKVLITFESKEICEKFIEEFNEKSFEDNQI